MTSSITYEGSLRTQAMHLRSGTVIISDAPTDNHGKGEAFSPTDLTATSLASCMLTIMGIKADNSDYSIDGTKAEVKKIMVSNPRRIGAIEVKITFPANNYTDKTKKILEHAALNCPVALSLSENIEQRVNFVYT